MKMEKKIKYLNVKEVKKDRRIQNFIKIAEKFCKLVEKNNEYDREDYIFKMAIQLSELYRYGFYLPEVEAINSDKKGFSLKEHARIYKKYSTEIGKKFKKYNFYWLVFDPFELPEKSKDNDPVTSLISGDIAEIYEDIKENLILFKKGKDMDKLDAAWELRFSFYNHWSEHLVWCLAAINKIISGYLYLK